jgi:hypothetical protein
VPNSALHKLQSFHQELYQHAIQASQHMSSMNSAEISAYSQNFHASLPSSFQRSDADQLVASLLSSQFMLFGDFHTLQQSQRGFLRILRHLKSAYPQKPLMVALEIFNAEDQSLLDEYLAGRLPEELLLKQIDYHNKWGFPWENYQPIVAFCSSHQIQICGINSQFDTPNRLSRRDAFAAEVLNQWATKNPEHLCLCLIGEYHLADQHLIAYLSPSLRSIRVVNNIDEYAFHCDTLTLNSTNYLKLAKDFYCVLNTAPWIKWQSLAMWEEFHSSWDGIPGDDFDPYTEQHYDFDYQLLHILKALNQFIGLNINTTDLSHFDLYIRPDKATSSHIKAKLKMTRADFARAEQQCENEGFSYISPSGTVLLKDPSINRFAEIAGFYLYDILRSRGQQRRLNFVELIERQICGTIAALIMNPRRPTIRLESNTRIASLLTDLLQSPEQTLEDFGIWNEQDRNKSFAWSRPLGEVIGSVIFQHLVEGDAGRLELQLRRIFQGNLLSMLENYPFDRSAEVA